MIGITTYAGAYGPRSRMKGFCRERLLEWAFGGASWRGKSNLQKGLEILGTVLVAAGSEYDPVLGATGLFMGYDISK